MVCTVFAVTVHCTVCVGEGTVRYGNLGRTVSPEAVLYAVSVECTIIEGNFISSIKETQTVDITVLVSHNHNAVSQTVIVLSCALGRQVLKMEGGAIPSLCSCVGSIIDDNAFLAFALEGQFLAGEQRQLVLAIHQNDGVAALCCCYCLC